MITLALDTSTARGAVALLRDDQPLGEIPFSREPRHDQLFAAIQQSLAEQKVAPSAIDLFVVGLGPGSFTGIRAGLAAIQGLALPYARPITGLPSYDAIALTAAPRIPPDCPQLCVLGDARQQEVYYALYDRAGRPTRPCRLAPFEAIADEIHDPLWFVSAEIDRFAPAVRELLGGFAVICPEPVYPSAAALGWLGQQQFHRAQQPDNATLEPLYLRETQYRKTSS